MKKIMAIFMCCCFILSSISLAVTNSYFSIDLPSDYEPLYEENDAGLYSNGEIMILYACERSGIGEEYKDIDELKSELLKEFAAEDGVVATFEEINGVNFLKMYIEEDDAEGIMYVGTTLKTLITLTFVGENLNETDVDNWMSTINVKGTSSRGIVSLLKLIPYIIGGIVLIVWLKAFNMKRKIQKYEENSQYKRTEEQYNFSNQTNDPYNFNSQNTLNNSNDLSRDVNDEWKF